jgi:hypothetical protein
VVYGTVADDDALDGSDDHDGCGEDWCCGRKKVDSTSIHSSA